MLLNWNLQMQGSQNVDLEHPRLQSPISVRASRTNGHPLNSAAPKKYAEKEAPQS